MLSREIRVSNNLVSYRERKASQIPGNSNFLCEAFRGNFKRKLGFSLCYHTISMRTFLCVCIFLIFRFAYLAYYFFCAMLFLVSHLSIVNMSCCLCYMLGVYLKSLMLCLPCVYYFLFSKTHQMAQYRFKRYVPT